MKSVVTSLTFLLCPAIYGQSFAVTTVAGSTHYPDGAAATSVPFRAPQGLVSDPAGGFYFSDGDDFRVFKVSASGAVTLIAGTGQSGYTGDGQQAKDATFRSPGALALDKKGSLYIADSAVIRKIVLSTGVITTFAGNGKLSFSGDGAPAPQAGMFPSSLAVDPAGQYLYLTDPVNSRIRRIDLATNMISTVAGNGTTSFSVDGSPAATSSVLGPTGLSFDSQGNLTFVEGLRVKHIKGGVIDTLAGTSKFDFGPVNMRATLSELPGPFATAYDSQDNLYIASRYDVRMVSATTGRVSKVAGGTTFGMVDGAGSLALFSGLGAIAVTPSGDVLVTDPFNKVVRRITNVGTGGSVTTVAGTDIRDGTPAISAFLDGPESASADFSGNIYIADTFDSRVRSVSPNGFITTAIGPAYETSGPQNMGLVRLPRSVTADSQGGIYVADTFNQRIFRQRPGTAPEVVAGGNGAGFSGDGLPAVNAKLASPWNVAVDRRGNIFIADYGNHRIRKVDASHNITTVAGNGSATLSGEGGAATAAGCDCRGVAVDNSGNLYIADTVNNRIRRVDAGNGTIKTFAGTGGVGLSGDGGPAASATLYAPTSVAIDNAGNLYIADSGNSVVRLVTPDGIIRTVAGTGLSKFSAESGQALAVNLDPRGVAISPDGSVLIADSGNDRVRRLTRQRVAAFALVQGATQNAAPGARVTLTVKVTDPNGIAVINVPVNFAIASGSASLSSSGVTGADGTASVALNLGATASGVVTVNASVPDLDQQVFRITVSVPVPGVLDPKIAAGGIAGAGLSVPAVRVLVPLGLATVFGQGFAPAGTVNELTGADLVDGRVPTQFAGVCVSVGTTRAPVTTVVSSQVTFQVPVLPPGPVDVRVITGCGSPNQSVSDPEPMRIQAAAPEFFSFLPNADGKSPIRATDALTGALIGKPGLIPGANFTAAHIGQVISLYANYFGETTTGLQAGEIPQGVNSIQQTVQVMVGGHVIPAANILYAGMAPFSPGEYQINLILDAATPLGDQPVTALVGGVSSPVGAYLTVQ